MPKQCVGESGIARGAGHRCFCSGRFQKLNDSLHHLTREHNPAVAEPFGDKQCGPFPRRRHGKTFLQGDLLVVPIVNNQSARRQTGHDLRDVHELDPVADFPFNHANECRDLAFRKPMLPPPPFDDGDDGTGAADEDGAVRH